MLKNSSFRESKEKKIPLFRPRSKRYTEPLKSLHIFTFKLIYISIIKIIPPQSS